MDMPTISRGRAAVYAAVVVGLLVVASHVLGGRASPSESRPAGAAIQAEPAPARELVVHVVGAVASPGLYRMKDGSRVDDAVRRAGGATPKAALELLNLAAPVADGQQVVVPARGRGGVVAGAPGPPGAPGGKVHLNSATLEQLDALPGVGPVTAQKILDYRTKKGAFSSVDELDAVSGIGPARLESLKDLVDL
jgi:competence protein ComEA